jgi:protein TonB
MSAFALHLPEHRGLWRWLFAALVIIALYAAVAAAVLFWPARTPNAPEIVPAIAVTLAPTQSAAPEVQEQDLPVGPAMQQADAVPPAPVEVEQQTVEEMAPPPPLPPETAEVALPKAEPKPIETPKEEVRPPAPETRAPPKNDRIGEFSQAGSNAYNALIVGHLARFKRYPTAARGAVGKTSLRFVLDRDGRVIDVQITKSSGNNLLDQEALAIMRRANPFPKFPAAKPGTEDFWVWTMNFDRDIGR